MAIYQTDTAKGFKEVAQPTIHGGIYTAKFVLPLTALTLAATDVVEIGKLPMYCVPRRVTVLPAAIGAGVNLNAGFMTGAIGAPDPTRTVGTEIVSAGAINATAVEADLYKLDAIQPVAYDRAIGLQVSADVAAGAGKSITVIMDYYQA